jgi:hypothetical protein
MVPQQERECHFVHTVCVYFLVSVIQFCPLCVVPSFWQVFSRSILLLRVSQDALLPPNLFFPDQIQTQICGIIDDALYIRWYVCLSTMVLSLLSV